MLTHLLFIIGGLVLLSGGAELLVRGSSSIAVRLGMSPLVVGLTIVAVGTGSPELSVSVKDALSGGGSIALGNIIGSNICNITLVLGVATIVRPLHINMRLVRLDAPIMLTASVLLGLFLWDGSLERWEGALMVLMAVVYTVWSVRTARREEKKELVKEFEQVAARPPGNLFLNIGMILVGLGLLVVGSNLVVDGAVAAAEILKIRKAVIGLTIVALGTSLPELATAVTGTLRRESDLVVGNIVGSNIVNILLILGAAAAIRPMSAASIHPLDVLMMIAMAAIVLPLMGTQSVIRRWEGMFLVACYAGYIWYLWPKT